MAANANNSKPKVQSNIDSETYEEASAILKELGINHATAISMFYHQIVNQGKLPFDVGVSKERLADIRLGAAIKTIPSKRAKSKAELMEWLENADKEDE
ncbi:type II toxin-antitoxin system RelB/DinJ family antitoxin [Secundilactobacillus malefermentans]|uniref:RelB/DinJ family addiction module antitoxin n=1 Tax=Secundilactobacillus malefermentans TaxID=176292 RepID=A0A4R5NS34_9LACO|nr:type II toxin-antitoxin system RelB/DinJ family antitoxin [Secundilactobacillus malefermentans]KRM56237.1 DNA-damage-inducible protein J [Secundilactobacillus malefermentans DSM 5705 = KCTC 3548]QEA31745.1 type II toxin-antitoxin system RelB/DinJ family antitoxin [Secundilactobacillus malefermentans]TDG79910.1 hypothetical protein C5L31_002129 [Secundilactobacillus malefermentans]